MPVENFKKEKRIPRIEVETKEGKRVMIVPAMLQMARIMGAAPVTKVIKATPKELIKPVKVEPVSPLPEMEITKEPEVEEAPKRKPPVRSKSVK